MTTTYTGECRRCGHEQKREWRGELWRGDDGEDSFAADCHRCGPGHELEMFPEEPADGDELVEVWSTEASSVGKTMLVERSSRWKVNEARSYVGALSSTGGPGGSAELEGAIPLAEFRPHVEGKRQ